MIRCLHTLKRSLAGRKLYLWDVGKNAVWTFTSMLNRELDVSGFLTESPVYVGETILNRPVLAAASVRGDPEALIILNSDITPFKRRKAEQYGECLLWPDTLEPNPALSGKDVYICGTGNEVWTFAREARRRWNVTVKGFLEEDARAPREILGLPVLDLRTAQLPEDAAVILLQPHWCRDMAALDVLQERGFSGDLYVRGLAQREQLWSIDPVIMLDDAMKRSRRILLCCEDAMGRAFLHRIAALYDIPIDREVCFAGCAEDGLEDFWSLADEDPEQSVLLIHAFSEKRRYEIVDAANDLGYSAGAHNYTATNVICYSRMYYTRTVNYEADPLLTASVDYTPVGGLPGWAVYGEAETADKRIMVLGGSTSSELFYQESWAAKLCRRLRAEGHAVVIYNGAHEGNTAAQELDRMLRDIRALRPDIVISMSGYNDMQKSGNKFEAMGGEPAFDHWRRIESYMKRIAEAEGAVFHAILQPVNQGPVERPLYDVLMFQGQEDWRAQPFNDHRRSDDFYTDLFPLFFGRSEMFIDMCHYSEQGNALLADAVYQVIKGDLS